jgi:hypothetical protein
MPELQATTMLLQVPPPLRQFDAAMLPTGFRHMLWWGEMLPAHGNSAAMVEARCYQGLTTAPSTL